MAFWICDCGRHVRITDAVCPFCTASRACVAPMRVHDDTSRFGSRCSRAAAFGVVCAIGIACGARTELDDDAVIEDAATHIDGPTTQSDGASMKDGTTAFDGPSTDVETDVITIPDVVEECIPPNGVCSGPGECCFNFPCMNDRCGALVLYGAPPPLDPN